MSMKIKLVKWFIRLLWVKYPYLMRDVVIPDRMHLHKNPVKRALTAAYPKTGE